MSTNDETCLRSLLSTTAFSSANMGRQTAVEDLVVKADPKEYQKAAGTERNEVGAREKYVKRLKKDQYAMLQHYVLCAGCLPLRSS